MMIRQGRHITAAFAAAGFRLFAQVAFATAAALGDGLAKRAYGLDRAPGERDQRYTPDSVAVILGLWQNVFIAGSGFIQKRSSMGEGRA
jgi:hypothetical protein